MMKLVEKLSMTRRWATDSRHITHSGGMYWSYSSIQATCSSGEQKLPMLNELHLFRCTPTRATTRTPRKILRALQMIDVHENDGGEGDALRYFDVLGGTFSCFDVL